MLATTWELENSKDNLERKRKSRIQLLKGARDGECVQNCSGQWWISAKEVLQGNGVDINYFGHCVHELLQKGRGKYRNLMIVGPANCAKTFLLNPLNVIFNTFSNPESTSLHGLVRNRLNVFFWMISDGPGCYLVTWFPINVGGTVSSFTSP